MNTKRLVMIGLTCIGLCAAWATAKQTPTPPPVILKNEQGEQVQLYAKSYALLIGVSDYTNGWTDLPGVSGDIAAVKAALWKHGFEVATIENPTGRTLRTQIEGFIKKYARDFDNRILIYFAGHGMTLTLQDGRIMGYIVPSDAPSATTDQTGFEDVALDMESIETYARQIRSKHALFLFDSCFSGSLFYVTRSGVPPAISYNAANPVRQFITSGSEAERVPDVSIFREQFIAALNGDGSDLNNDGYLTGEELAFFLKDKVRNYSHETQHPQYSPIRDPKLDKGDVVFALPKPASTPLTVTPTPTRQGFSDLDALAAMEEAFAAAQANEGRKISADTKREYWRRFAQDFSEDLPGFDNDEEMRQYAAQRIADLRQPTPTPPPAPPQQGGEQTSPLLSQEGTGVVGSCWENAVPGATCTEEHTGMEFVYVPGDCFMMGSPKDEEDRDDDERQHKVCVHKGGGFWMGKYEVTQAQWETIMGNNPSSFKGAERPVETVSWNDTQTFLKKLNTTSSIQFRLPTESEWEYAARAGTTTPFYFGETISTDQANYDGNYTYGNGKKGVYRKQTTDVGSFPKNAFGLYDMHGNVWEWCQDTYGDYNDTPKDGSAYGSLGDKKAKLLRGGSWYDHPYYARSASRGGYVPVDRDDGIGFRVVAVSRTQ